VQPITPPPRMMIFWPGILVLHCKEDCGAV
jgi:hypothetical protein